MTLLLPLGLLGHSWGALRNHLAPLSEQKYIILLGVCQATSKALELTRVDARSWDSFKQKAIYLGALVPNSMLELYY